MSHEPVFSDRLWTEPTPAESDPKTGASVFPEIGFSSAPLASSAFFLGQQCKDYTRDFDLCKMEGKSKCLPEGRKVTRCGVDVITKISSACGDLLKEHAECLTQNNLNLHKCRKEEKPFNDCIFQKLAWKKVIPGTPEGTQQIHERTSKVYY